MDFNECLLNRYKEELSRIEKLKSVNLNFQKYLIDWKKISNPYKYESLKKVEYEFMSPYKDLSHILGPVVYYYKIEKGDISQIWKSLFEYKKMKKRTCPEMKIFRDSSILYVGSETRSIARRTTEHFGFANKDTAGLHLYHWAPKLDLKLSLHYSIIDKENICAIRHVEAALAKQLNPLVGRREK